MSARNSLSRLAADAAALFARLEAAAGREEAVRVWKRAMAPGGTRGRRRGTGEYDEQNMATFAEGMRAFQAAAGLTDKRMHEVASWLLRTNPGLADELRPGGARANRSVGVAALGKALGRAAKVPVPAETAHGEAPVERRPGGVIIARLGPPQRRPRGQ